MCTDGWSDLDDFDSLSAADIKDTATVEFVSECHKCRGTGKFVSYSGRPVGPCFTCKGTGKLTHKTSPQARAKAKASRVNRAAKKSEENLAAALEAHPAEYRWITFNANKSAFAESLARSIQKYGSLTERQSRAVLKIIAKEEHREANRNVSDAGFVALVNVFVKAKETGAKRPILRFDGGDVEIKVSVAKDNSKNAGHLYVKADGEYLGKITPAGVFVKAYNTTDEQVELIKNIGEQPLEEAKRYGRVTGSCSVCGRELTNKDSIEAGIGPICAEAF